MMRHGDAKVTPNPFANVIGDGEQVASEKLSRRIGSQLDPDVQLEPASTAKTA